VGGSARGPPIFYYLYDVLVISKMVASVDYKISGNIEGLGIYFLSED